MRTHYSSRQSWQGIWVTACGLVVYPRRVSTRDKAQVTCGSCRKSVARIDREIAEFKAGQEHREALLRREVEP